MADAKANGGFDYDPFNPPPGKGVGLAAAADTGPAPDPKWKEAGFDYNPFTKEPEPEAPPGPKPGIGSSFVRGTGGIIAGTGRALEDVGLPTRGMTEYGQRLVEENPATVTDVQGALRDPVQFAKETTGSVAPQVGLNLAGATTGRVIGGVLGGFVGTPLGPEGTVLGAAGGQELGGKIGQFLPDFLQQYGNIRQTQDQTGVDDKLKAAGAAATGAALDLLNPAEAVTRQLAAGGLKEVAKKGIAETAKQVAIGGVTGAGTMAAQSELQRYGSGQDLTGPEAQADAAISALTGGLAGGVIHGGAHVLAPRKGLLEANNQSEEPPPPKPYQLRLPAPGDQAAPEGGPQLRLTGPGGEMQNADLQTILQNGIMATESHGQSGLTSPSGAMGLNQVMPKTARQVAARLGLDYSDDKLLHDDQFNTTIAQEHLSELNREFNGDKFLAVMAYNAGSGNVRNWVREFGYDPANPHAFLDQVRAAGNPHSADYPLKVMQHLGVDDLNAGGISAPEDTTASQFDLTTKSILSFIRNETMNPETKEEGPVTSQVSKLAQAVSAGDDEAQAAIAQDRARLDKSLQALADKEKDIGPVEVEKRHQDLVRQERVLEAATEAARRAQRERGTTTQDNAEVLPPAPTGPSINLITEPERAPFGRRPTMAGEPDFNPNPDLPRAADTTLADQLRMEEANAKSARTQMEQPGVQAAQSAAERAERGRVLGRVVGDETHHDPRQAFQDHLKSIGLSPELTAEEEMRLRSEENFRRTAAERAAIEAQRSETERNIPPPETQDTSLGVPEREPEPVTAAPAEAPAAPEPAPAPEPAAPAPEVLSGNVRDRADAAAEKLGSSQREWFRRGAHQALGDVDTPAPTRPSLAKWFKQGQDFVNEERAAQEREAAAKAAPPPEVKKAPTKKAAPPAAEKAVAASKAKAAPKKTVSAADVMKARAKDAAAAKAKDERQAFADKVDAEVGKTITAQQAQQLNIATDMQENLGKESVDKFSVKELNEMLATAQNERAAALRPKLSKQREQEQVRARASLRAWHSRLRAELDRRGMGNVRLITSSLEALAEHGEGTQGAYHEAAEGLSRVIEIAHNADDPLRVLSHETVHALRDMGVFKPDEWEALVNMAKGDKHLMEWIGSEYGHLDEAGRNEEAVAEMFSDWAKVHSDQAGLPFAKRMMAKIKAFFTALHQSLTRSGYKDAASVMADIESGRMGRRFAGESGERAARGEPRTSYAGAKAKTADLEAREKALAEHDKELARQKFGWHRDEADGLMKFEVDDSRARLKEPFAKWPETAVFSTAEPLKLGDVLGHPALFAAYPELADIKVTKRPALFDPWKATQGWYNEKTNTLNITPYATNPESTLIHEVQHAVQGIEGFARGGSPDAMKLTDKGNQDKLRLYYERKADEEHAAMAGQKLSGERPAGGMPQFEGKLARLGEIQSENSPVAKQLAEISRLDEKVWDAETAVSDLKKKQVEDRQALVDAYNADRAKVRAEFEKANAASWQGPREERPAQRAKADDLSKQLSEMRYPKQDLKAEQEALAPHKVAVENAIAERDIANRELKKYGDFSDMKYDLYQLLAGEVEARDTEQRRNLSADQRRMTPPGAHEGVRAQEQIVNRTVPSGAPDIKYSRVRSRPADQERRTTVDRSARWLNVTGQHWLRQSHVLMATTKDLARMMAKHVPSAQAVVDLHSRSHAIARDFQERLVRIKDAYQSLPSKLQGIGTGTVNEFLHDSTMAGKWGFQPDYQPNAVIDGKLAERFNAMPEAAQKVIKDVFKHNYDARNNLYQATVGVINTEYDPSIAAAKTDKERETLQKLKARALAHFSRVFDTQEGLPYTPLKREGNWAVVGKSRAYVDADERGDQKEMDRLRSDPKHYFVDFRDSVGEADALQQRVEQQFGDGDVYAFPRDKVTDDAIGGKELYLAFDQLRKGIQGEADKGSVLAQRLHRLATDLYLHTLSETSARKGELGREGVSSKVEATGETVDMMKAFVSRGNATANYVASMSSNPQMQAALDGMRRELSYVPKAERADVQRMHNEMMTRYVNNLSWRPNRVVDRLVHGVTGWNLLSSPFYYMQNATQAVLISHPILAGRFGYGRATAEMGRAYVDFARATKNISLLDRIDFAKFPEKDLMQFLAERGHLDAGYQQEFNSWDGANGGMFPATWGKASRFFRQMPQRVEIMNRAVTGLAAFRAAVHEGMSREEAMAYAGKLIDDTHGDYSGFNSPRPFNTNVGKVMLQFRKFQLIMGGLVGKQFHQAFFAKDVTRAERIQAIKGIAFLGAHLAAIGGIMGLPGANFVGATIGTVQNLLDPNEHKDWQEEVREALGAGGEGTKRSTWADFLYKGAPYALMGMDTSDRMGMGNVFSFAPYLDMPSSNKEKAFSNLAKFMLGPSGGLLGKLYDGWGFAVDQHDWERTAEAIAPTGVGNALQAYRLKTQGLTNKRGDVLLPPEDISNMDAFYTAIGVRPSKLVNQADRTSVAYDTTEFYKLKSQDLKNQYAQAFKTKDAEKLQALRDQFKAMQDARVEQKFKREPMSTLLKAPHEQMKRERSVIGGIESTKANRMYLADLMFSDNPMAARELEAAQP